MFSAQLDAASEAHIARGYVPCTPATLCLHPLHPLHPLQLCNAPLLSCTDASPSHFAILNVRRLFIEIQYLQVKLLPQMSATLHLSNIPDSPEPNASHPSSTFWMKPHLGWKFHQVQQGACTAQFHLQGEDALHPSLTCSRVQARMCKTHSPVMRFHLILHPYPSHSISSTLTCI